MTFDARHGSARYAFHLLRRYGVDEAEIAGIESLDSALNLVEEVRVRPRRHLGPVVGPVEGVHLVNGHVARVVQAVNGSGHLYAQVLDPETGRFEYAPGLVVSASKDTLMSAAEAAHYGRLYGRCMVCAATLTNPESIAAGIGPVCVQKFGMSRTEFAQQHPPTLDAEVA